MSKQLTEEQASQILRWNHRARDSEYLEALRNEAKQNRGGYYGDIWSDEDRRYYRSKGIEPVSVNRIKPIIKTAIGIYLQNQQDIKVIGKKGVMSYAVQAWNSIFKDAEEKSDSQEVYTNCFTYGCVDKVGYLKYETNPYKTVNGQPKFKALTVLDVDYDPTSKLYNLNEDARYVIEKEWMYKDEAQMLYPEIRVGRKEEILKYTVSTAVEALAGWMEKQSLGGTSYDSDETNDRIDEVDVTLRDMDRVLIRTMWWKELIKGYLVTDPDSKETRFTKKQEDLEIFKEAGYEVKVIPAYRLYKTVLYNNQILQTVVDPLGEEISDFPIFRFSPLFYDGKNIGMVDNLLSLQREENINRTQINVYLNSMNNSGYLVAGGSEPNKQSLAENATKDDVIIDESYYDGKVEKIPLTPYPAGIAINANDYDQAMKAVSGISDAAMGGANVEESGRAIYLRTQQNRTQFQEILDNFFRTLKLFGTFVFNYIRINKIYTEMEIYNIIKESDLIDPELMQKAEGILMRQTGNISLPQPQLPAPVDPQMMAMIRPEDQAGMLQQIQQGTEASMEYLKQYPRIQKNYEDMLKEIAVESLMDQIFSEELADYVIEVTISPHAPSESLATFAQLIDINNALGGGVIPPDILIESSIVPASTKRDIKARMAGAMGTGGMALPAMAAMNNTGNVVDQMKKTEQF